MKRRGLLLGAGIVVSSLAGCLGNRSGETNDSNNPENTTEEDNAITYEQCPDMFVSLDDLPKPAKEEANTAIENGVYETDGELILNEVLSIEESYLLATGRYYNMTVTTDDGVTRLRSEEVVPKEATLPVIDNGMETDVTVDLRIEHEGSLLLEDTITLRARSETALTDGNDYPYGQYRATLKIQTGGEVHEEEVTWSETSVEKPDQIVIHSDGVGWAGPDPRPDRDWCSWNDEGGLVEDDDDEIRE
ncbi:hypothetical protein ACFQDG_11715 [Natronoarchaeum mannanilyticum]|uniref:hypothetical protein n=1 Tax=Natronoarchaeum mannanilyticum TaxID=926360 RepID=UPI0031DBD5BE